MLLNIDKIDEEPGVGCAGLDVVVVVEAGVEDGTEVIYVSDPAPEAAGEERGGAAVFVVKVLHGGAELIDGVLAAPVTAVVSAKEVQIRVRGLQHGAELAEELLLLLIGMLALKDHPDVDVIWAQAQEGECGVQAAIGGGVLHEAVADDDLPGLSVKPDAEVKELRLVAVVLLGYADALASGHPGKGTQPPVAGLEVAEAIVGCYLHSVWGFQPAE